jgi:hypothetical protein
MWEGLLSSWLEDGRVLKVGSGTISSIYMSSSESTAICEVEGRIASSVPSFESEI